MSQPVTRSTTMRTAVLFGALAIATAGLWQWTRPAVAATEVPVPSANASLDNTDADHKDAVLAGGPSVPPGKLVPVEK